MDENGLHSWEGAVLTSPRARSCGGSPLSGPQRRFLRRHTLELCWGQLDPMGPTIDRSRRIERPPYPPPSPCDQLPKRRAETRGRGQGRGERRMFGERDQPLMRRGEGAEGRWQPRDLLLSHVTA